MENEFMRELDLLVKNMLEEHIGGEVFFENLDREMRSNEAIVDTFIDFLPDNYDIISSGRFGRFFSNYFKQKKPTDSRGIVVVNGGLRNGIQVDNLSYLDLKNKKFIFVDDSFYSGATRNVVQEELRRNGSVVDLSYVLYDGSKKKRFEC